MDTNKIFIDIAQRAREFAEMCERMANETKQKADPEAWREECRKKQAAGVKFEFDYGSNAWEPKFCSFTGRKEWYREVPQPSHDGEYPTAATGAPFEWIAPRQMPPPTPHAAERALWKAQRDAGTNEVWQCCARTNVRNWVDLDIKYEPNWIPDCVYRVKPMKLTARIARYGLHLGEIKAYDWEFTGTREDYRAECEKYGYAILSEIKEVKHKTVKYYFALVKYFHGMVTTIQRLDMSEIVHSAKQHGHTIIGDIEEREVEA